MPKKPSKFALSKGLRALDLFEDTLRFNVDGAQALKTSVGGVVSLVIIVFLLVQFIMQSVSISNRENPTIVQTREIEDDPLMISLNKTTNFAFAIGILRNNTNVNMTQGSALSFESYFSHQIRAVDGTTKKNKGRIFWAPCVPGNFSTSVFPDTTFTAYSLKYAYCPTKMNFTNPTTGICPDNIKADHPDCITSFEFALQGTFLSFNFKYLQVSLHACDPEDADFIKGLTCDPNTNAFDNYEYKVNLYYSNILIDPVNYEAPNKTYIDNMYWSVHPSVYKLADIYVDAVTVQDYDDYFSTSDNSNRTYYSLNIDSMRETQVFKRSDLLEINLRRSSSNAITIRRYPKVLDVVSSIGGISKVFMVIGAIIALGYSRYKHQMMLSNKLYDFPQKDKNDNRSGKGKQGSGSKSGSAYKKKSPKQTEDSQNSGTNKGSQPSTPLQKPVEEGANDGSILRGSRKRLLKFDGITYLKEIYRTVLRKKDQDMQLGEKARAQVTKDLDIIKMIEKLKEIDKLKMILLNHNQREAFDFIEKPLITLKDDKPIHRDIEVVLENNDDSPVVKRICEPMSKYARLYMVYTLLKTDSDPVNRRANRKIINMISEDLIQMFQKVDEQMGDTPDPRQFDDAVRRIMKKEAGGDTILETHHLKIAI